MARDWQSPVSSRVFPGQLSDIVAQLWPGPADGTD
jgi:hypothetical protein